MKIKPLDQWITEHSSLLLGIILLFSFIVRIWRVQIPPTYYFDEVYHAVTSKLVARNDERAYEWWHAPVEPDTAIEWTHPPLAKLFKATGILIFGENSFGWRISSVIFGVLCIFMVFSVSETLFKSKPISLLAAFLFSMDGLPLTQSRIAMNDIHLLFFMLLSVKMYLLFKESQPWTIEWKKYLILSGVAFGLTFASKWSGIVILGIFIADQFLTFLKEKHISIKMIIVYFFAWIALPIFVYSLSFSQMFLQGKSLDHFRELNGQMYWYHSGLVATHPYQSKPLQWVLNLRPVWLYVDYSKPDQIANMYAQGNTALYLFGFFGILVYLVRSLLHSTSIITSHIKETFIFKLELHKITPQLLFVIMAYFIVWLPYTLSPRIMFFYHYLPAVPYLSIASAFFIYKLLQFDDIRKTIALTVLSLIIVNFVLFYPNWTGMYVSTAFRDNIYGFMPSWK